MLKPLRYRKLIMLGINLILVVLLATRFVMPPVVVAQEGGDSTEENIEIESGLDVVVLIDEAVLQLYLPNIQETVAAMYRAVGTMGQYLSERTELQSSAEQHTLSVISFRDSTATVRMSAQSLPVRTVEGAVIPPTELIGDPDTCINNCYSNFLVGFETAQAQFARMNASGDRRQVLFILTDDVFGNTSGEDFTAGNMRTMTRAIADTVRSSMSRAEIHFYGFYNEPERWRDLTSQYWSAVFNEAATGDYQLSSAATIERDLLDKVREMLPAVGESVAPGIIDVEPYLSTMTLFYFRNRPNNRAELIYEGDVSDDYGFEVSQSNGSLLQSLTVRNPPPGRWRIRLNGGTGLTTGLPPRTLELVTQQASFRQEVRVGNSVVTVIPVDKPVQIVWQPVGFGDTVINYGSNAYNLNVRSMVQAGNNRYSVPLTLQDRGSLEGSYVGEFYGAYPGSYVISTSAAIQGEPVLSSAPDVRLSVTDIEFVVTQVEPARQFEDWSFSGELSLRGSEEALLPAFGDQPRLTATITLENGVVMDVPIRDFDAQTGLYTSEPLNIVDDVPFSLSVSAVISDMNNAEIELPTRDPNGQRTVTVAADNGTIRFETTSPRLLDTTRILYQPRNISATELANLASTTVYARIAETPQSGEGTVWRIPMILETLADGSSIYAAPFYATRDVVHTLSVNITMLYRDVQTEIVSLESRTTLDPRPVVVSLESQPEALQFANWDIIFSVLDGDSPLTVPFTSNVALEPQLRIRQDSDVVGSVPLSSTDALDRYVGTYTFIRSGSYDLDVTFNVPQNPYTASGEPEFAALPTTNTSRAVNVRATGSLFQVLSGSQTSVDAIAALTPISFALANPDITTAELHDVYDATAQLTLRYLGSDETYEPWVIEMEYVEERNRFETRFVPVSAGNYSAEAIVRGGGRFGNTPLLTTGDIGTRMITVRPVVIEPIPLSRREIRQTDTLTLNFTLRDGDQRFDGTTMGTQPRVTVTILNARQTPVFQEALIYSAERNGYTVTVGPFAEIGDHTALISAEANDSLGRTFALPTATDQAPVTFNIVEALNMIVSLVVESTQYSAGALPFSERQPMIVDVQLYSQPNSSFIANGFDLALAELVDPSRVLDNPPEDWYTISVFRGEDELPRTSYQVSQPEILDGKVRYKISGLPNGSDYIVKAALADGLSANFPYIIPISTATASVPINYSDNPVMWIVLIVGSLTIVAVAASGIYSWRKRTSENPPIGWLYLTDDADRVVWAYDLTNIKKNSDTIKRPHGWERARIDSIQVISNYQLKRQETPEQARFKVVMQNGSAYEPILMDLESPPRSFGDGRFKLSRSATQKTPHTAEEELRRVMENE